MVEFLQYRGGVITVPRWNFYGTVVEFEKVRDLCTAVHGLEKAEVGTFLPPLKKKRKMRIPLLDRCPKKGAVTE